MVSIFIIVFRTSQSVLHSPYRFGEVDLFFGIGTILYGLLTDVAEHMVYVAVDPVAGVIGRQVPSPGTHVDGLTVVTQVEVVPWSFVKLVFVFETDAFAVGNILTGTGVAQCFAFPVCRPHIGQFSRCAVGARVFVNPAYTVLIVEVVTQLEQGAYVFPILRVRFAARYAATAVVGTAGIRAPALFVVGDDSIGSITVVFGFFTEAAGVDHQCVQTQPSSCGSYAAEFLAVASDIAAFNA